MAPASERTTDLSGIVKGTAPEIFSRIHNPNVELVLWQRQLPICLETWLASLPADHLPDGRVLVSKKTLSQALRILFANSETPAGPMQDILIDDISALALLFMQTMGSPTVDIRLEVIDHDACWKFHRDMVPARLVTTYCGPGTEYVFPNQTDSTAALRDQKDFAGAIHSFPRHAVGLFKGSRALPSHGVVHRSPPIADSGERRLFLCLNLPSPASPPLWTSETSTCPTD